MLNKVQVGVFLLPPTPHVRKDHALSYSTAATADSLIQRSPAEQMLSEAVHVQKTSHAC